MKAGEDLEEEEEEELEAEILPSVADHIGFVGASADRLIADTTKPSELSESSPLLRREGTSRSLSRIRRRRKSSVGPHGDATVTQAVLMLLKGFVGTGVLFLGKAFMNGGILFSTVTLVAIALISLWSFLLLVKAKQVVHGSFGDIGGALYGPWMRYAILSSIIVSQLGFVCAYIIFVSENLQAFVLAITDCARSIPVQYLILSQLIIFMPLALIRNLAKLSTTALIADAFILAGLLYIFGSEFSLIAKRGVAKVELFNPKDFLLLIGTAVFSFEGIGLVIPISDAMRDPSRFPGVLTSVMIFLTFLFGGAGALAYAAFGSEIQTVVIVNLDAESKLVQALFPAVRIMENGLFVSSGKQDLKVKWQKNAFRFLTVMFCALVSWIGAADLDKFVALVGSFACVPLCYLYPPMLHYKACARTRKAKIADVALMIFGAVAAVYTTAQTIRLMAQPAPDGSPKFGRCDIPPALLA